MKVIHIAETIKGGVGTCLNVFDSALGEPAEAQIKSHYVVPQQHADHLTVSGRVITFDRPRRGFGAIRNLIRTARKVSLEERPDILFFQSTYSLLVMAAFRIMRIPGVYVYNPHGWAWLRYSHRPRLQSLVGLVEGRLSRLADIVINVSQNDRRLAASEGYGGNHTVIENAMPDVSDPPALPKGLFPDDKINLLFVGRFDRQKGLDVLLEAYRVAAVRNPRLHLHIIGAAVEDGEQTRTGDLPDSITFHGWVTPVDIPSYFASADLVLVPSRWESLPMVIIEALRGGTPVMLSDMCGMGSLIDVGQSGYCIKLTEQDWAEAMGRLKKPELATKREASRRLFEIRYNQNRYRREMLALMDVLLAAEPVDRNPPPR